MKKILMMLSPAFLLASMFFLLCRTTAEAEELPAFRRYVSSYHVEGYVDYDCKDWRVYGDGDHYADLQGHLAVRSCIGTTGDISSVRVYVFSDMPFTTDRGSSYCRKRDSLPDVYYFPFLDSMFWTRKADIAAENLPGFDGYFDYSFQWLDSVLESIDVSHDDYFDLDSPDSFDPSYSLTGFRADGGVNASWTGATERSFLTEVDVSEFVRAYVGYCPADDFGDSAEASRYDAHVEMSGKSFSVPWQSIQREGFKVRYVKFVPMYSSTGGAFGAYFYGNPSIVWFTSSGGIQKVETTYDMSKKHDFSKDVYSADIPVPELENLSYNGFTVSNMDGYYLDIIAEPCFYGAKIDKLLGLMVDMDWKYAEHYYNLAECSNLAYNASVVDIKKIFGVSIQDDLIGDLKKWSLEYPRPRDLPTWSFWRDGSQYDSTYAMFRYDDRSIYPLSDLEQLNRCPLAQVTYYVRFYDERMRCGQWARYTFSKDSYSNGYVTVGQPETDRDGKLVLGPDGNPVIGSEVSGKQDKDTGSISFGTGSPGFDIGDTGSFFSSIASVFDGVQDGVSSFGSLLAACFVFLPGEVVGLIVFGIVLMVFVGIVKAVV